MMANHNSISVIIPVHNTAPYIERTVRSILGQTCRLPIEILLVENGSTDGSMAVITRLAEENENITGLISPRTGPSEARNFGISNARGDLVAFIDSDDYIDPEMFETLVYAMRDFKADMAYCNYQVEHSDGTIIHPFADTGGIDAVTPAQCAFDIIMEKSTSSPCVRLFERSFFNTHQFPEGKFYEDHDCVYRWASECRQTVHIDKPFYHYCIRDGSTTTSTAGNPSKIIDLFYANLGRISYICGESRLCPSQRKEALSHVVHELFDSISQIAKIASNSQDTILTRRLKAMLSDFVRETSRISIFDRSVKLSRRMLMMKFTPERFISKLARRR